LTAPEILTYPYDAEYKNAKTIVKIAKQIEVFYRQSFKKYVDKMVTFSKAEEIFGVKTIKINNGIVMDSIPLKTSTNNKNEINLIAVASMQFWHGYDRLIDGLKNYYSKKQSIKVFLQFVGDSNNTESLKYKHLIDLYKLNPYITFHGFKNGSNLDELFNLSDLAIGCLGVHRKNIKYIKSLKNSEYCARGIPFVYSEIDDSFQNKSFVQDNLSFSRRGVLRGLHYQWPRPQGKLVQCLRGEVLDVVADIRRGSTAFGRWMSFIMNGDDGRQLYIPEGCAHGFVVMSDDAHFIYKCTDFYAPASERGLAWDDPKLAVGWRLGSERPLLSEKDQSLPTLETIAPEHLPLYEGSSQS
jgi:dTDP-4-dehydrorhamnose 3,5-epimerase